MQLAVTQPQNSVIVLNAIGTTNFRDMKTSSNLSSRLPDVVYKKPTRYIRHPVAEALDILDFLESAINSGNQTSIENGDNADESLDVIQAIYDDIGANRHRFSERGKSSKFS